MVKTPMGFVHSVCSRVKYCKICTYCPGVGWSKWICDQIRLLVVKHLVLDDDAPWISVRRGAPCNIEGEGTETNYDGARHGKWSSCPSPSWYPLTGCLSSIVLCQNLEKKILTDTSHQFKSWFLKKKKSAYKGVESFWYLIEVFLMSTQNLCFEHKNKK